MTEDPYEGAITGELENILLSAGFARRLDELIAGQRRILERLERLRVLRERCGQSKKK